MSHLMDSDWIICLQYLKAALQRISASFLDLERHIYLEEQIKYSTKFLNWIIID